MHKVYSTVVNLIIAERISARQLLRVVFSRYAYVCTCRQLVTIISAHVVASKTSTIFLFSTGTKATLLDGMGKRNTYREEHKQSNLLHSVKMFTKPTYVYYIYLCRV